MLHLWNSFFSGRLFTGQDIRGKDKSYDDLKETYQISFLVSKVFFDDAECVHTFEYYDPARHVSLGGKSRIITVELAKLDKVVTKPVEEMNAEERWEVFLRFLPDKSKRDTINEILRKH